MTYYNKRKYVVEVVLRTTDPDHLGNGVSLYFGGKRSYGRPDYPAVYLRLPPPPGSDKPLLLLVASITEPICDLSQYCTGQLNELFTEWEEYAKAAGFDLTFDETLYRKSEQGWEVIE